MNKYISGILVTIILSGIIACKETDNSITQTNGDENTLNSNGIILDDNLSPPGYQIKEASIRVVQGNEIYANGKMQAVIRVNYKLKSGARLTSLKLQELNTGRDLSDVGWTVDSTENEYAHNIDRARDINSIQERYPITYVDKYLSTKNANENMTICFEIVSTLEGKTDTYSTCKGEGFTQGAVNVFARRAIEYTNADFSVYYIHRQFTGKNNMIFGDLYGLKAKDNVPRNVSFTVAAEKIIPFSQAKILINSDKPGIKNYIRDISPGVTQLNAISYASVYFLKTGFDEDSTEEGNKTNYVFTYLMDDTKTKGYTTIKPYQYRDLLLFLRVAMNWGRTQYNKYVCNMQDSTYKCWDGVSLTYTRISQSVAALYKKSVPSQEITLTDNYGTNHKLFLSFTLASPYYENFGLQ